MRKKRDRKRYVTYKAEVKKKPHLGMRFIAKWSVPVFVLTVTAVVYVWERNTIISLGYGIREMERAISVAESEGQKLQVELMKLQRPQRLMDEIDKRRLGLVEVSPSRVKTLVTPRPVALRERKEKGIGFPPAASWPVAELPVAAPHRESSVLRQRR
jgi:cell division protein FtsL